MRLWLLASGFSLFMSLSGCFGGPPETKYYTLRGAELPAVKQAPAGAPVVLVDTFTIDEAYGDARIAYREGTHELGFDPYARWAGPPGAQVEDAVRDLLRGSGLFAAIRQPQPIGEGRSTYDLVVTGRVARLEEVDVSDDEWQGALDLELFLLDGKSRAVLHSYRFAGAEKAEKRNPRDVAAAIARMLAKAVDRFDDEIRPIVARRAP